MIGEWGKNGWGEKERLVIYRKWLVEWGNTGWVGIVATRGGGGE